MEAFLISTKLDVYDSFKFLYWIPLVFEDFEFCLRFSDERDCPQLVKILVLSS